MNAPQLVSIKVKKTSREMQLVFADQQEFALTFEFLRVHSPSAEVKGHGPGQEILQIGKRDVVITAVNPVGHYAFQITFNDGHDSGLYSTAYLYRLGQQQEVLWQDYLASLERAGESRDPDVQVVRLGN
jgi:DUF971 family protein